MILVLMGVSGVGKTTIGWLLSARTGWRFEDADDYHSEKNRQKMAAGIPLTDADREPWLDALHKLVLEYYKKGVSAILACSALKESYREVLSAGLAKNKIQFVYLHAPAALVEERMESRHHPYMRPAMLESQLATLQIPSDAWPVTVAGSPEEAAAEIVARLREANLLTAGAEK
jgi:gluconokinase